jgi:type I restriction enzyme R subunit
MLTDTSEKGLESLITQHLCLVNGFVERYFDNYNRSECVDEELLFKFLEDTQPREVARLKQSHGNNFRQRILHLVNRKIEDETVVNGKGLGGIINLLRTEIIDGNTNIKLKLFYDRPVSNLNPADAERYEKNIFSVTRQVHYSTKSEKSLDLVVFINGLPVITFELKNELTRQNVKDAIKQYKTTRDQKEKLFRLARCLVHFAVDTEQVWMCTHLKGENSFFLPFNKGNNNGAGNPPNPAGIKTDYLWKEILTKESITNIIQNYVLLIEEDSEKILPDGKFKKEKVKKLIFPRYHQLDVVRNLLADAKENGAGKRYLIQHSAGSGKSNSISWLAHQLVGLFDKTNTSAVFDSVIVVNDRIVLDSQTQRNIRLFEQVSGLVEHIDKGSKHLKVALEEGKKIIITTIQKFPHIVNEIGELPGNKFAIIIDEAHSSQSGNTAGKLNATLSKDFEKVQVDDEEFVFMDKEQHDELTSEDLVVDIVQSRKMLTNASYFAFTATPKAKTLELFGIRFKEGDKDKFRAFHLYSMKQAIQEHFIEDVLLNYTTYKSHFALLKKVADDPLFDKKKAQKKLRIYVESLKLNIGRKTAVMVDHFMTAVVAKKKINGLAKAMVVTSSRRSAVEYKRAFDNYLKSNNIPYKAIVAFSGEIDGQTESSLNGFSSESIPDEFKKANNRFLIVANKYQTGFDQPLLHTMYVDKKLGGVSAVQTLSRLNRTTSGKTDTFVLDFANTTDEIKKSFDPYYESTILGEATDPNKLFDLQTALDAYQVYTQAQIQAFSDKIVQNIPVDQLHIILDTAADIFKTRLDETSQEDFRAKCKSYVRLYVFLAQIVPFTNPYLERLYIFLNHLQNKIPKEQGEDLAQGVLDTIDLDSYRLQKQGEFTITLQQGDELMPSSEMSSGVTEPEMELLSNIVKAFNDRFGTQFTNEDKVRKMAADLMQDVKDDKDAMDNINASLIKNDVQNAQITFTDILKSKMINHIDSNFEVFKEYNDNPEFKAFLAGQMFKLLINDLGQFKSV